MQLYSANRANSRSLRCLLRIGPGLGYLAVQYQMSTVAEHAMMGLSFLDVY